MHFSPSARIMSVVAAGLVAMYVLTSLSFVAPDQFKGSLSGLADASRPYFSQSWRVFAPNILKSNIELRISAQWYGDDGELEHSPWFSATDIELASVAGMPLPSRTIKQSWNLVQAYNRRFIDLNEEQRATIQNTFIRVEGDGFTPRSEEGLIEEMEAFGDNSSDIRQVLFYDDIVKEYATYMATAYFDERIIRVRWEMAYSRPNSFESRHSPEQQFDDSRRTFGWRMVTDRVDPVALETFERIVQQGTDQ